MPPSKSHLTKEDSGFAETARDCHVDQSATATRPRPAALGLVTKGSCEKIESWPPGKKRAQGDSGPTRPLHLDGMRAPRAFSAVD